MGKPFLADLHVHSNFSDGKLSIPELVDFYGRRGFGCIAITDHVCDEGSLLGKAACYLERSLTPATYPFYRAILRSEMARAWDQYGLVLIPGFELTKNSLSNHRSAHLLALGVSEYIGAEGEIEELANAIRDKGGLSVAAHPVSTGKIEAQTYHLWDRREELADVLDAWEVASGKILFDEVRRSGLPMIATSDLHRPSQITAWKTVFTCERRQDAILDAIRRQDLSFEFYREVEAEFDSARVLLDLRSGRVALRHRLARLGNGAGAEAF